ncbi:IS1-like element transposase [Xenorhabdus griffiniae]
MKDQIESMAVNNGSIRDTARVLKVGINTVLRMLKIEQKQSTTRPLAGSKSQIICEIDGALGKAALFLAGESPVVED